MKQDAPEQIIKKWEGERNRYPGWIVLPWKNRERVFRIGKDLSSIIKHIAGLEPENRIAPMEQVVWRCETTLNLPSWYEGIEIEKFRKETVDYIINSFNDLPDRFHEAAISLLVSHLREARFTGDEGNYRTALAFLETSPHVTQWPELLNKVRYQQGIYAASYYDDDALNRIVDNWPTVGDVYWQVRRAGLMLDSDRPDDALKIVSEALMAIRSRQDRKQNSIFLRSREAYALFVQRAALAAIWSNEIALPRRLPDIEWDRFNSIRSNPVDEITHFQTRLAVLPTWKPRTTRHTGFDPGSIRSSTSFSGDYVDENIDAREWLAFCEEVGLSPHRVQHDKTLHERAFSRTAYASSRGGFRAMVRCNISKDAGDSALMRCRVASMSKGDVTETYLWLSTALTNSVQRLKRKSAGPNRSPNAEANVENVAAALSFLYCRLDEKLLNEEVYRLKEMYFSEIVRHNGWIHEDFTKLWERLIAALPTEKLKDCIPEWLTYPLPNMLGFGIQKIIESAWPDPARIALFQESHRLNGHGEEIYKRSIVAINDLITVHVGSENQDHRLFSSMRVGLLHWLCPLPNAIQKRFCKQLWSIADNRGLPKGTGFEPIFFLSLPSSDKVEPESLLRKMIDSGLASTHPVGDLNSEYFELARQLTISEIDQNDRGIVWTEEEISKFVARINEWWGSCSPEKDFDVRGFFGHPNTQTFEAIARFLLAISTSIPNGTDLEGLDNTIDCMFIKRPHSYLLLAKAIISPQNARNCEDRIADALLSDDEDVIWWAIGSLYRWTHWSTASPSGKQLPLLGEATMNKLYVLARIHRQPCLKGILHLLGKIVATQKSSTELHSECVATLRTLEPKATYKIEPWSRPGQFYPAEVPAIREGAASLARHLEMAKVDDPVVQRWRQGTLSDPLPEVRRAATED